MSYMPPAGTNEVTISPSQPNPPTDIWIDTDEPGGTTNEYVLRAGDTMAGSLATPNVEVSSSLRFAKDTSLTAAAVRWQLYRNGAETGSNAGSDLVLGNLSDTGTYLGNVFYIYRSTGAIVLSQQPIIDASVSRADLVPASGWTHYQNGYGNVRVTRWGPLVTLTGMFGRASDFSPAGGGNQYLMGMIPVGFRPDQMILATGHCYYSAGMIDGRIDVKTDGTVYWTSWTAGTWTTGLGHYVGFSITYRQGN